MHKVVPKIALVICTRNRVNQLQTCLETLSRLRFDGPWELIIVDNGSTDGTRECLSAFAASFPSRLVLVTEDRPGLGRARNRAWRASTAPVIAFTDDDCYPEPDFLTNALAVFDRESLGFAGGKILLFDPTDAPITINTSETVQYFAPDWFVPAGVIQGANMVFCRQALEDINGFDEYFGAGTPFPCEDVDAVLRVLAAGWKGKHDPGFTVYHHHRRKPGKDIESLTRVYAAARGAYYAKCLLFMPQRRQCLRFWYQSATTAPILVTWLEVVSALRYGLHLVWQKLNTTFE